jgi:hypothetical protein
MNVGSWQKSMTELLHQGDVKGQTYELNNATNRPRLGAVHIGAWDRAKLHLGQTQPYGMKLGGAKWLNGLPTGNKCPVLKYRSLSKFRETFY